MSRSSLVSGPLRSDLFGRNRRSLVAPGTALVIDDVGDVGIAQGRAEWRHRAGIDGAADVGPLQSVQHDVDVLCRVGVIDHRVTLEWRECSGQAFTGGLMASGAGRGKQTLTLGRIVNLSRG